VPPLKVAQEAFVGFTKGAKVDWEEDGETEGGF